MVDVEHRALCAFEQHVRSVLYRSMHSQSNVFSDRQNPRRYASKSFQSRLEIGALLHTECSELRVRVRNSTLDTRAQSFRMPQVEYANAPSCNLVLVSWT